MNKILYIVRGVSGSGKSTFAETLGCPVFSADDYFTYMDGSYKFDASELKQAHEYCQNITSKYMKSNESKIAVANTFTQEWEMSPYFEMADRYKYRIHTVIVENRHGNKNIHNVPDEKVLQMEKRFEIKL